MADDLTLMAVHAHPDDESSSTGGVLAAYGDAGVRTVVVTCTNGEFGDAPGGVKPGQLVVTAGVQKLDAGLTVRPWEGKP